MDISKSTYNSTRTKTEETSPASGWAGVLYVIISVILCVLCVFCTIQKKRGEGSMLKCFCEAIRVPLICCCEILSFTVGKIERLCDGTHSNNGDTQTGSSTITSNNEEHDSGNVTDVTDVLMERGASQPQSYDTDIPPPAYGSIVTGRGPTESSAPLINDIDITEIPPPSYEGITIGRGLTDLSAPPLNDTDVTEIPPPSYDSIAIGRGPTDPSAPPLNDTDVTEIPPPSYGSITLGGEPSESLAPLLSDTHITEIPPPSYRSVLESTAVHVEERPHNMTLEGPPPSYEDAI